MPTITGQVVVILTVQDAARSASWYSVLLGAVESSRYQSSGGPLQVTLVEPISGLELCLLSRAGGSVAAFDEHRIGLDHLEFHVATRAELDRWVDHLDQLRIAHSGIKEPQYASTAMVTFRDPDNIQVEFFWAGR